MYDKKSYDKMFIHKYNAKDLRGLPTHKLIHGHFDIFRFVIVVCFRRCFACNHWVKAFQK